MLTQGLIRRVGNGATTSIWEHKWLPNHFQGKPITPRTDQIVQHVNELITPSGHWNVDLIEEIFLPIDADSILRIP